jgi:hypothetical protein
MSLLKEMLKNRASMIEKLKSETGKSKGDRANYIDDRFWQPTRDKVGNALAEIRFLPSLGDELPYVENFSHAYQNKNNGLWFIEECPTTINQKCPLCDANSILWNTGLDDNKKVVRDRKRKHRFISNILVIDDQQDPKNNGQVKLFKYGKKIFDKIMTVMHPAFKNMEPLYPFDIQSGANFLLRVRQYEGYPNYDLSEFGKPSLLGEGDEAAIEKILQQIVDLKEFADPSKFKTYAQLQARLNKVLGEVQNARPVNEEEAEEEETHPAEEDDLPASFLAKVADKEEVKEVAEKKNPIAKINMSSDDDSEIENYLASLAADDE